MNIPHAILPCYTRACYFQLSCHPSSWTSRMQFFHVTQEPATSNSPAILPHEHPARNSSMLHKSLLLPTLLPSFLMNIPHAIPPCYTRACYFQLSCHPSSWTSRTQFFHVTQEPATSNSPAILPHEHPARNSSMLHKSLLLPTLLPSFLMNIPHTILPCYTRACYFQLSCHPSSWTPRTQFFHVTQEPTTSNSPANSNFLFSSRYFIHQPRQSFNKATTFLSSLSSLILCNLHPNNHFFSPPSSSSPGPPLLQPLQLYCSHSPASSNLGPPLTATPATVLLPPTSFLQPRSPLTANLATVLLPPTSFLQPRSPLTANLATLLLPPTSFLQPGSPLAAAPATVLLLPPASSIPGPHLP